MSLRSVVPYLLFSLVAALFGWTYAAGAGFAAALIAVASPKRDPFGIVAAVFFGALSVIAMLDPSTTLHRYVPALTPAALSIAAVMTLAAGAPFTIMFAKRVAPPEFWDTALFMHINVVLTAVWAASFALTAFIVAFTITFAPHAAAVFIAVQVASFVIPMRICRRYPRLAGRRVRV